MSQTGSARPALQVIQMQLMQSVGGEAAAILLIINNKNGEKAREDFS